MTPPSAGTEGAAVVASALRYRYKSGSGSPAAAREALAGVDFSVARGEIFGFLGPNGGGKSTLFRILATLMPPDSGAIRIFGSDLLTRAAEVRRRLGVVFQNPSLDLHLSVRENLVCQGHLYGLRGAGLAARIDEALDRFGLADRRNQRAKELSGGLRRRVELAKALLHRPGLLLLDEPSTGLDPGARRSLWEELVDLREQGITVLLTTHFMEEGDRCDRLLLVDRGMVVAAGEPGALKAEIGGDVISLTGPDPEALAREVGLRHPGPAPVVRDGIVRLERLRAHELVARLFAELPGRIDSVTVARPSLEDVFLRKTGRPLAEEEEAAA
jgi:ABC-2 type transport system ATP-binding protein